ncbi:MAG: S8 family serine peptidase [Acidimicrobiia bacterium]|nr:S8 family serine peptidase [Acidimicrobiia bacterium]
MHGSKRLALVLMIMAMFAALLPVSAQESASADAEATGETVYVWALVGDTATSADLETAAASVDGVVEATSTISGFDFDSVVRIEVEGTDNEAAAARLSDELGVTVAPGNTELTVSEDPLQAEQWALDVPGEGGIETAGAWERSRGADVVVAVADSGIDPTHPDIADIPLVSPYDFIEDDEDPQETIGHGTAVSSLIAAPENGVGMVGAAPEASIMPLRVCPDRSCDFNAVLAAVAYAGENGADIVNLSLGGTLPEGHSDAQVINDAIAEVVEEHDILVIAAAGNDRGDASEVELVPAEGDAVLGVASSSQDGTFTEDFTNAPDFGSSFGPGIGLAAPGDNVITATAATGEWARGDGTSYATPLTSGVAALIEGANDRSSAEVEEYLLQTVTEHDSFEGRVDSGGKVNARYSVWASKFTDSLDIVFIEDIAWIAQQGVTIGCNPPDNDLYCSDWEVEREEMASFIARALDLPAATQDYFEDDNGSVHEDDINAIREAGISYGCNAPENTRYCPTDVVTRGQMAAFLSRAFGYEEGGNDSAFTDHNDSVFYEDINKLARENVTIGCNPPQNDRYCAEDGVLRGQMAAFLRRAITSAES